MPYTRAMTPTGLRKFLDEQDLTQIGLAMLLEIDPRTVRRYVSGDSEIPKVIELACRGLTTLKKERPK
jgi:hypothetical protein